MEQYSNVCNICLSDKKSTTWLADALYLNGIGFFSAFSVSAANIYTFIKVVLLFSVVLQYAKLYVALQNQGYK